MPEALHRPSETESVWQDLNLQQPAPKESGGGSTAAESRENASPEPSVEPAETAGNETRVRNPWCETPEWPRMAADAAIRAYLRAMADGLAARAVN